MTLVYFTTRGSDKSSSPLFINSFERLQAYTPEDQDYPDTEDYYKFKEKGNEIKFERIYEERLKLLEEERIKREKELERKRKLEEQKRIEEEKQKEREQKEQQERLLSERKNEENQEQSVKEESDESNAEDNSNGNWKTFEGTAYTAFCDTGCTGITATGLDVSNTIYTPNGKRVIAVDPSIIPLNSTVKVRYGGNEFVAKAVDTGGAIKGYRVDILVSNKDIANNFGRRNVEVKIIN